MQFKNIKLNDILFLQPFGVNKEKFKQLGVNGHIGIDISIGKGQHIPNFGAGICVYANKDEGTVVIVNAIHEYSYGHLDDIFVEVGKFVEEGQPIGLQGSKGSTVQESEHWTHIHFGLREIISGIKDAYPLKWNFPFFSPIAYSVKNPDNGYDGFIDPSKLFPLVIERVAEAQAKFENMPAKYNNPGALRWSPFQTGSINDSTNRPLATFNNYQLGRKAQIHQLTIAANGKSAYYKPTMTVKDFIEVYAPASDRNSKESQENYIKAINDCGFYPHNQIKDWLLTEMQWIQKNNRGLDTEPYWVEGPITKLLNLLWTKLRK